MRTFVVLLAACAAATAQSGANRIAVFQDDLPGLDPSAMQATLRVLESASLAYTPIHLAELSSPEAFNAARFDTLILNHSDHLAASARDNLLDYLKAGGDLVLLGGSGFLHRQSMTLPAFSRYEPYALDGIEAVDTVAGQDIVSNVEARGHYTGCSAVGFTRRAAKFIPLLAAKDRYGRTRGWACGLLTHYAEYPGSNWLLFGIDTPAFYSSDAFAATLHAALGRMRGEDLWKAAQAEHQKAMATRIRLTTPAPAGFVHASPDGKRLLTPDGKPLFLTGVNYHRGLDQGEWSQGTFDDTVFADDFRKAHEAGINFMRLGPAARFYDSPEIVRECARKYGIYLIIILNWGTRRDFVANAERVAQMYASTMGSAAYICATSWPTRSASRRCTPTSPWCWATTCRTNPRRRLWPDSRSTAIPARRWRFRKTNRRLKRWPPSARSGPRPGNATCAARPARFRASSKSPHPPSTPVSATPWTRRFPSGSRATLQPSASTTRITSFQWATTPSWRCCRPIASSIL